MQLSARHARARRRTFAALVACAIVAGCTTGNVSPEPGTFGGSAGGPAPIPPSTPSGEPSIVCPTTAPVSGSVCYGSGICEIGGNADPSCNVIARCYAGEWVVSDAARCPLTCPARFDLLAPGEECSGTDVCTYLEATCGCAGAIRASDGDGGDGGDGGGDDDGNDAGDAGAEGGTSTLGHWQCVRPGNGCPARRPIVGSRCFEAMTCDYGSCVFGAHLAYQCLANISSWVEAETETACP